MNIHIRHDIGSEIWYVDSTATIGHSKVTEVNIRVFNNSPIVRYTASGCLHQILEENAFGSREELLKKITGT